MKAIDTNVLIRLLAQDDPKQTAAAERFVRDGAWVPALALAETLWVLGSVYGRAAKDLANAVEMLLEHDRLVLQDSDIVKAALQLFRSRPALGFSDCFMLESARRSGSLPLGTFDRNMAKASGAEGL